MIINSTVVQKLIISSLVCSVLALVGCDRNANKEAEEFPRPVVWVHPQPAKDAVKRKLSGVLNPAETANVSFEVPGKVEKVYYEIGHKFKKGDTLASLDKRVYELNVEQRKSELSEAKAKLLEAENDFKRKTELLATGAVSKSVFDISQSTYQAAKDNVSIAQTRLEIAYKDLTDTEIFAPYDGAVSSRYIEPSQLVSTGEKAFTIQGLTEYEVAISMPETLIGKISIDQEVKLKFPAIPKLNAIQGHIKEIGSQAQNANSFPVKISLETHPDSLKTGMTVEVTFSIAAIDDEDKSLFVIPITAFAAGKAQDYYILQITGDNKLKQVPIHVYALIKERAIIEGPISEQDKIVRTGLSYLRPEQSVTLIGENIKIYNP